MFDKKKYNADYRKRKPEKARQWDATYKAKHRDKINAQARARYHEDKSYQQEQYKKNKAQVIERVQNKKEQLKAYVHEYKKGKTCTRCPESDARCLDFHHRIPETKLFAISKAVKTSMSLDRLIAEISKCDLLCRNCHAKEHIKL